MLEVFSKAGVLLFLAFVAWGAASPATCHAVDGSDSSVYGFFELRYDGRFLSDGEDDDHKLHQVLDLHVEEKQWGHFRFTLSGDMTEDLDGTERESEVDRTITIRDTWDSSAHGFLYVFQGEIYDLGSLDYLRFGRQYVQHELGTSHIDGIDCMLKLNLWNRRVKPFVYAGIPVRLYDPGSYWDAQQFGLGADLFLDRWTKLTLEHQIVEEEPGIVGSYMTAREDRYEQSALAVKHRISHKGYGYVSFYLLDNDPRHVDGMFSFIFDELDLHVDASYFYQFDEIESSPTLVAPYTGLVGPIKPYHDIKLDATKGIYKDVVWLSAGTQWRFLDSGEDETEFNHSYNNEYVAVIVEDFPQDGIRFSVEADFWNVMDDDNDDSILTVGGQITYDKSDQLSLSAGSSYALFKYDYFADDNEETDVYTIHSSIRYHFRHQMYLDVRYELDIHDINEHRVVTALGFEL